jgi:hypothetical protein
MLALLLLLQAELTAKKIAEGYELSVNYTNPALPDRAAVAVTWVEESFAAPRTIDRAVILLSRGAGSAKLRVSAPGTYLVQLSFQRDDQIDAKIAAAFDRFKTFSTEERVLAGTSEEWARAIVSAHRLMQGRIDFAEKTLTHPPTHAAIERLHEELDPKKAGMHGVTHERLCRVVTEIIANMTETGALRDGDAPPPGKPAGKDPSADPEVAKNMYFKGRTQEKNNRPTNLKEAIADVRRLLARESAALLLSRALPAADQAKPLAETEQTLTRQDAAFTSTAVFDGVKRIEKDATALKEVQKDWHTALDALKRDLR